MNSYPSYVIAIVTIVAIAIMAITLVSILKQKVSLGNKLVWIILTLGVPVLGSIAYFINLSINKKPKI